MEGKENVSQLENFSAAEVQAGASARASTNSLGLHSTRAKSTGASSAISSGASARASASSLGLHSARATSTGPLSAISLGASARASTSSLGLNSALTVSTVASSPVFSESEQVSGSSVGVDQDSSLSEDDEQHSYSSDDELFSLLEAQEREMEGISHQERVNVNEGLQDPQVNHDPEDPQVQDTEETGDNNRQRFKRRIRQPISRVRQKRKEARNRGEENINSQGNLIPEKIPQPLPACRKGCSTNISPEICVDLCNDVWKGLGDQNRRSSFIASLVEVKPKATQRLQPSVSPRRQKCRRFSYFYHVIVNGENIEVCKGCFMKNFQVSSKFIDLAVQKKISTVGGIVSNDARGKTSHPLGEDEREEIRNFLDKIPKYKSHYARSQCSYLFLPPSLNLKIIYEEYCKELGPEIEPVSRWSFEREFHEMGLKIKPRKIDTCHTCDKLDAAIKYSKTVEERQKNTELLDAHHEKWEEAREKKKEDISQALQNKGKCTAVFDLQQCLPTPLLETSVVFYKRQLWTYNLTIHNCATKNSVHNMWHEGEGERGPNQIGSSLYHFIMALPSEVEALTVWSDTCGGQNKNSIVAAALTTALLHHPTLKQIDQKFLVPGHTHMECDTDHSTIEGCKKRAKDIFIPRDWMSLVRNSSSKFEVVHLKNQFDFKSLLKGRNSPLVKRQKGTSGEVFRWKEVVWMRHEKGRPGLVAYKTRHLDEVPFSYLDIRRKRSVAVTLSPQTLTPPIPISHKKKDDLISLLHLVDPDCAPFYYNLKSDKDMEDVHPDLLPSSDEEESAAED